MRIIRPAAVIILVGAFVAIAIGQQTLVVDVNLTLLTFRVRDQQGMPAPYLTAEDFEILEEGQQRPVSHFVKQTQPVAIGLMVDRSISVSTRRDAERPKFSSYLQSAQPNRSSVSYDIFNWLKD